MNSLNTSNKFSETTNNENIISSQEIIEKLEKSGTFKVYDSDGKYIFSGGLESFTSFLIEKKIEPNTIGGFTDNKSKNIIKFGPGNLNGFTHRSIIKELIQKIIINNDILDSQKEEQKRRKIDKLKELSTKIYLKHRHSLSNEAFLVSKGVFPFNDELETFEKISGEIGQYYDAHGIDKGNQLENLILLLSNGIDPSRQFFTAPFEIPDEYRKALGSALGTAGGTAYQGGIATVVSGYKESLTKNGIKYVFINDVYEDLIEQLKECFPEYSIHLLSEQKKVLSNY